MTNRWTNGVALLLAIFTLTTEVHSQDNTKDQWLTIDGQLLRWGDLSSLPVTITYTYARSKATFAGGISAQNCLRTEPLDGLIQRSKLTFTAFNEHVLQAMQSWEAVTNVRFVYTDREGDADILIAAQEKPKGIAWANLAVKAADDGAYRSVKKSIICLNPELMWSLTFSPQSDRPALQSVIQHEIGHVLGLDHQGKNGARMSYRYSGQTALTLADIEAVQVLYGKKRQ